MDITTLTLTKQYTDKVVATGGDPEKTEQLIRDLIAEMGGSSVPADWSINDETVEGYIKNRTHYDLGEVCVPDKAIDGTEMYWEGPTGSEIYGQDYFIVMEQEGTYFYAYKVSDEIIDFTDMDNITGENLIFNYMGSLESGDNLFDDSTPEEIMPGYVKEIFVDGIPVLASIIQEVDLSVVDQEGIASPGTYFIYAELEEGKVFLAQAKYQKIKQLDLKYIPELAFGDIDMVDYGTSAKVTVTKRDGTVKTIYINDGTQGSTPERGKDYWTEADKLEIKSYVDNAILQGVW